MTAKAQVCFLQHCPGLDAFLTANNNSGKSAGEFGDSSGGSGRIRIQLFPEPIACAVPGKKITSDASIIPTAAYSDDTGMTTHRAEIVRKPRLKRILNRSCLWQDSTKRFSDMHGVHAGETKPKSSTQLYHE